MYSKVSECRVCGSKELKQYLDLGPMPLANALVRADKQEEDLRFPLQVVYCDNCKLSQLSVVVDPKLLFTDYPYRTSVSSTFQAHFLQMAEQFKQLFPKAEETLVLDIASNDGCELIQFKKLGFQVLGVEPSENLVKDAEKQGVPTIARYWDEETAQEVLKRGKPKIVTACNVFAHVNDIQNFLQNVKKVLDEKGILAIEVPHALNLIQKNEFDTIYHEHLSYFLVKPFLELFQRQGFEIFDIQETPIHGGSLRVMAKLPQNKEIEVQSARLNALLEREKSAGLYAFERYQKFASEVKQSQSEFRALLEKLKLEGKKVAGFGAAAKASTLMHSSGVGKSSSS
ncbi:MAG: class I SAM-dependent methyltransferase, partial [Candidatus Diapherotrites archaeon]